MPACLTRLKSSNEKVRPSNAMTFNTNEVFSVIIMDTKLAAFGIDLSGASRVYFVSSVWQTATFKQAVKRAHRIGQTHPTFVETLMYRSEIDGEGQRRPARIMQDDRGVREILSHLNFMPLPREDARHRIPALQDYVALQQGDQDHSYPDFEVPLVFPLKAQERVQVTETLAEDLDMEGQG